MSFNLEWCDDYCIDGGIIDSQHKKLLEIAGRALQIKDPSSESEILKETILALFQYMEYHFIREEEYAEIIKYPKLDFLKKSHSEIIVKMNTMMKSNLTLNDICNQLRQILVPWIINHMIKVDRDLGRYPSPKEEASEPSKLPTP
jgi:hemerythrin